MNRLSSRQRKLVYLVGIVVLLTGSAVLGIPATGSEDAGGIIPSRRQQYDLGESNLGKVDPSSATMNLVLLGMRGLAANQLWLQHEELKKTKNWAQMRAITDSIITLQPHYLQVWRFHGWDLAYNVSAEWDDVRDRYFWVKEGTKFNMEGADRNRKYPELPWEVGDKLGKKIGRSDEWRFFRDYFKADPDEEKYKGGPDPELSRAFGSEFEDNYLAAKAWYRHANDREDVYPQSMMMKMLFRHYPARSQFDYADALQREGIFEEQTRLAWEEGHRDWTYQYADGADGFGQEEFPTEIGPIKLENTPAELKEMSNEQLRILVREQNTSNYRYWKARADLEATPEMVAARDEMHRGREEYREGKVNWGPTGDPPQALSLLESGMQKYERVIYGLIGEQATGEDAQLRMYDDSIIEEGLLSILYWRSILQLGGKPIPESYPLKRLWDGFQNMVPSVEQQFQRETRTR
jgi:hypothetical protein